jgi:calcium-dependent protein kinase
LIDFGVSKRFYFKKTRASVHMWTRTGNIFYQAPEIFQGGGYNEKGKLFDQH